MKRTTERLQGRQGAQSALRPLAAFVAYAKTNQSKKQYGFAGAGSANPACVPAQQYHDDEPATCGGAWRDDLPQNRDAMHKLDVLGAGRGRLPIR
jgi:hypothetical protein